MDTYDTNRLLLPIMYTYRLNTYIYIYISIEIKSLREPIPTNIFVPFTNRQIYIVNIHYGVLYGRGICFYLSGKFITDI